MARHDSSKISLGPGFMGKIVGAEVSATNIRCINTHRLKINMILPIVNMPSNAYFATT
jgi:hypothetical protein